MQLILSGNENHEIWKTEESESIQNLMPLTSYKVGQFGLLILTNKVLFSMRSNLYVNVHSAPVERTNSTYQSQIGRAHV
mgnify:CR=1 FL=1